MITSNETTTTTQTTTTISNNHNMNKNHHGTVTTITHEATVATLVMVALMAPHTKTITILGSNHHHRHRHLSDITTTDHLTNHQLFEVVDLIIRLDIRISIDQVNNKMHLILINKLQHSSEVPAVVVVIAMAVINNNQ